MACNVFGRPITDETLMAMKKYEDAKEITREDRAHVVMEMKNAQGKDVNARQFVENITSRFEKSYIKNNNEVFTMLLLYNATGDNVTLIDYQDFHGSIGESPCPFMIANGQWDAFCHLRTTPSTLSSRAVLYSTGADCGNYKWLFAWNVSSTTGDTNKVYNESGLLLDIINSNRLTSNLQSQRGTRHHSKASGCLAIASLGNTWHPVFEGIMTLDNIVPAL